VTPVDVVRVSDGQLFPAGSDSPFVRKIREWITLRPDLELHVQSPAACAGGGAWVTAKDGGKNVKMKDGKEKNVIQSPQLSMAASNWKWWLNNTTVTLGMQNVFDEDPPFVLGNFENGYDESLTTIKGRFLVCRAAEEEILRRLKTGKQFTAAGSLRAPAVLLLY
jgi:hypothetical protein